MLDLSGVLKNFKKLNRKYTLKGRQIAFSFRLGGEKVEDNLFGIKTLYAVTLKATFPIEVNGRIYETGEVVARFDEIQVTTAQESKTRIFAQGGYLNRRLIMWEETHDIQFSFSKGIFSTKHLALSTNSNLFSRAAAEPSRISFSEEAESDSTGVILLKYDPIPDSIFLYNEFGEKISYKLVSGNIIKIDGARINVLIDYEFLYGTNHEILEIGNKLLNGYLKLEGKMRVKEESEGPARTAIFEIPQLRIMSGLSIRMGDNVSPMVNTFIGMGTPIGQRGKEYVCSIIFLEDDIDADPRVSI